MMYLFLKLLIDDLLNFDYSDSSNSWAVMRRPIGIALFESMLFLSEKCVSEMRTMVILFVLKCTSSCRALFLSPLVFQFISLTKELLNVAFLKLRSGLVYPYFLHTG